MGPAPVMSTRAGAQVDHLVLVAGVSVNDVPLPRPVVRARSALDLDLGGLVLEQLVQRLGNRCVFGVRRTGRLFRNNLRGRLSLNNVDEFGFGSGGGGIGVGAGVGADDRF